MFFTDGDLSADFPGVAVGTRHHDSGRRERLVGNALARDAAKRLAVVQTGSLKGAGRSAQSGLSVA